VEYLNKSTLEERIIEALHYNWEFEALIKSIRQFQSEYIVSGYESILKQYEYSSLAGLQ